MCRTYNTYTSKNHYDLNSGPKSKRQWPINSRSRVSYLTRFACGRQNSQELGIHSGSEPNPCAPAAPAPAPAPLSTDGGAVRHEAANSGSRRDPNSKFFFLRWGRWPLHFTYRVLLIVSRSFSSAATARMSNWSLFMSKTLLYYCPASIIIPIANTSDPLLCNTNKQYNSREQVSYELVCESSINCRLNDIMHDMYNVRVSQYFLIN